MRILYTKTFAQTLALCVQHVSSFNSKENAVQQVRSVIENFEKLVLKYPDASSISPHLLSLGVADFRAYTSDGFTILYQHVEPVNESKQAIVAAVFCSQKQDLPRLLIDYCLIYK